MDIKLDIEGFSSTHLALEEARRSVSTLDFTPSTGVSKSAAMAAFKKNANAYCKLLDSYSSLLDNDCQKLLETIRSIVEADKGEAKTYLDSIPNITGDKAKSNAGLKSSGPMY